MTTRQFYYLTVIADLGNLSAAAQKLQISQPALSKFLTEYEASLGFQIFLRYHRHLAPTSVGRCVIEYAHKIVSEQNRLSQSLRTIINRDHACIRLGTTPNRGSVIYSRIYQTFMDRYPDISLSLTERYSNEQTEAVLKGQVDLTIGSGKSSDKVTDIPVAHEELLVALPAAHPLASSDKVRLSDLKDTPFVLQGPRHNIRILAEELFKEAGFEPVITFESDNVIIVDSMLHHAAGAGFVSKKYAVPCNELVFLPLDPPVYQETHIRFPLGHKLTEPEQYLAFLLIRDIQSNPEQRFEIIPSKEVNDLLQAADPDMSSKNDPASIQGGHAAASSVQGYSELNLNPQLLRYVIAIVDEKSLTKAAEKFYLTQPTLSRYLHGMEKMLGARLFTREHNKLLPTNAGKVFVNFARNILQIEEEMSEHIKTYQQGHDGGIYLQCDPSLLHIIQTQVIPSFKKQHPDIQLNVSTNSREQIQESLLNASADYGVYFSCEEEHPILDSRILDEDELVYCSKHDLLSDPLEHTKIMTVPKGNPLYAEQKRLFQQLYLTFPATSCEAVPSILFFLEKNGIGNTILPSKTMANNPDDRHFLTPAPGYFLIMAHHPIRTMPPVTRDLETLLYDTFETYFEHFAELFS